MAVMSADRYQIVSAAPTFTTVTLPTPFKLGKGEIRELTLAQAEIRLDYIEKGRITSKATGMGAVFFSPVWADGRLDKLKEVESSMRIVLGRQSQAVTGQEFQHPFDVHRSFSRSFSSKGTPLEDEERLAPLVYGNACAPLDAALWDAFGKLDSSSYPIHLPGYRPDDGYAPYEPFRVDGIFLSSYRPSLPILHTVSGGDAALDATAKAIREEGVRAFKVKVGKSPEEAAARVRAVAELAADLAGEYELTVDANEMMDGDDVSRFCRLASRHESYECIHFLEQPVSRNNHDSLHLAARLPLVADEGVASHTDIPLYAARGWKGVALKPTAKGHTETILMAALASKYGMFTTVQDLTNPPPYALRHHLLFAASLAGLAGPVEYNSRQFLPPSMFASSHWDFSVRNGRVAVPPPSGGLY